MHAMVCGYLREMRALMANRRAASRIPFVYGAAARWLEPPLRLVQPGAALTEKRDSLGGELKCRAGVVRRWLHVSP
jgi:hypothetical protein